MKVAIEGRSMLLAAVFAVIAAPATYAAGC